MDYDGDGIDDLVSGSYDPGECYLFRGLGKGEFAARQTLVDKNGAPILRHPQQQEPVESFGSWLALVDWDDDGDLDIVLGGYDGSVVLRMNEGTRREPAYAVDNVPLLVDEKALSVPGHHATPVIADWDGDGLWDLLSGSEAGAVYWYRNGGQRGAPKLASPVMLVPEHQGIGYDEFLDSDQEPVPGIRAQIAVADYDLDGKLDLLVGDFCTTISPRAGLSDDERVAMKKAVAECDVALLAVRKAIEDLRAVFAKYSEGLPPEEKSDRKKLNEEFQRRYQALNSSEDYQARNNAYEAALKARQPFLAKPKSKGAHDDATPHGYVWLFRRK